MSLSERGDAETVSPDHQYRVCCSNPNYPEEDDWRLHVENAQGEVISSWEADSDFWQWLEDFDFCWHKEALVVYSSFMYMCVFERV